MTIGRPADDGAGVDVRPSRHRRHGGVPVSGPGARAARRRPPADCWDTDQQPVMEELTYAKTLRRRVPSSRSCCRVLIAAAAALWSATAAGSSAERRAGRRIRSTPLASGLASAGRCTVVDLTQLLTPATPIIQLPPPFANTPGFKNHEISQLRRQGAGLVLELDRDRRARRHALRRALPLGDRARASRASTRSAASSSSARRW